MAPGSDPSNESVFNMAFAYLKRIDKILYFCWLHGRAGAAIPWLHDLRALYRELSIKLNEDEEKGILVAFEDIYKITNDRMEAITQRQKILHMLDQLEVKMRKILQLRKMLLPTKDDPRWAVLKR